MKSYHITRCFLSLQFDRIGTLIKDFEPFRVLWIAVSDWLRTQDAVMTDPLSSVDAMAVEKQVSECYKIMHKSIRVFHELVGVQEVASQIRMAIEEFKPFVPLIQALRNPGMQSRHWELMTDKIGIIVVPKASLTFSKCLEMRLQVSFIACVRLWVGLPMLNLLLI